MLIAAAPAYAEAPQCPPATASNGDVEEPGTVADWDQVPDQRVLANFIGVSECWAADTTNDKQRYLNDLYTSLVVERISDEALPSSPQRPGMSKIDWWNDGTKTSEWAMKILPILVRQGA